MSKPIPAHGTPGRYRGGVNFDPCRCPPCSTAKGLARKAEDGRRLARAAGILPPVARKAAAAGTNPPVAGTNPPAAVPELSGEALKRPVTRQTEPGPVGVATAADIKSAGAEGTGLAALAMALAAEIDEPDHRLVSIASAARQLRECLADLAKVGGVTDDPIDALIAELQAGPAPVPPALRHPSQP